MQSQNNNNQGNQNQAQIGICDVHRLVDKDLRVREVQYCGMCDAWMCEECWGNLPKRAYAMSLRLVGRR